MTAAIIIARGGSKRLPRKNVRDFCGLPLVAWSILQAKYSYFVDWVFLSTDDDEIEAIGQQYGAEVIRRPNWPDANQVSAIRVFIHAIDTIAERGYEIDTMVGMLPTSPLRKPDDIDRGIVHHEQCGWHVIPMARNRETVLFKDHGGLIAKGELLDNNHSYLTEQAGMFHICEPSWLKWYFGGMAQLLGDHDRVLNGNGADVGDLTGQTYYIECEPWQCTEVDTLQEFELAEVLMEHYIIRGRGDAVYRDYERGENDE